MNDQYLDIELKKWYSRYQYLANEEQLQDFIFRKEKPAIEPAIAYIEKQLKTTLPPSFKQFFLGYSKCLHFHAKLSEEMCNALPPELSGIFSLELIVSLTELVEYKKFYTDWCEYCFDNMDDPYDRVWHNKLPFIEASNGDYIAFDLADVKEEKQVVYLSHDGCEGHGYVLGKTFSDFLKNYIAIGCCGPEAWQILPFIKDKYSGIDATCENAKQYRRFIGVSI